MSKIFKNGKNLESFLRLLAEESVKKVYEDTLIGEEDKQEEQEEQEDNVELDTDEKETEIDDETAIKKEDDTEAIPAGADITFYMLRDKLNVIRSGKSLKDPEVKTDLQGYFDRLDDVEKEALYTFLDSIGKVMIDIVSGTEALDPSEAGVDIEMSHSSSSEHDHSDAEVSQQDNDSNKVQSQENDTPPIRVGQPQITENIRQKIKDLMR